MREDGTWSFRIDICEEDKVGLLEGELHDLLAVLFRDLLDLKRFQEAAYHLDIPFYDSGIAGSVANVTSIALAPEIIAMCSALGMGIEIYHSPDT